MVHLVILSSMVPCGLHIVQSDAKYSFRIVEGLCWCSKLSSVLALG